MVSKSFSKSTSFILLFVLLELAITKVTAAPLENRGLVDKRCKCRWGTKSRCEAAEAQCREDQLKAKEEKHKPKKRDLDLRDLNELLGFQELEARKSCKCRWGTTARCEAQEAKCREDWKKDVEKRKAEREAKLKEKEKTKKRELALDIDLDELE